MTGVMGSSSSVMYTVLRERGDRRALQDRAAGRLPQNHEKIDVARFDSAVDERDGDRLVGRVSAVPGQRCRWSRL